MPESYRAEQGTISPSLFLGLGGVGSRIVDRIAMRVQKLPNWDAQLRDMTKFVAVDTNKLDLDQLRHIPAGNQLLIGDFDKNVAVQGYRKSKNQLALHWLDAAYEPRAGRKPGAGQIRIESRLGYFYQSPKIRRRLVDIVNETLRQGNTWRTTQGKNYNVYVFCTLAGGTGSGSFLSLSYLLQRIIQDTNEWQPIIIGNLLLSTLIDGVGQNLQQDIHANCYAALKELEHMTKLNYLQVRKEGRDKDEFVYWNDESAHGVQTVSSAPFFLAFVFDKPTNFTLKNAEHSVADSSFLQIFTPNLSNMRGALDNYEKNLADLTRFPGDLKHVGKGYAKNYGAMGAAAMILTAHDLLDYCSLRFAAEALRSQITFGVSTDDGADDRARALAKLAVDYNDPKFLNMSEEGRDRAINAAFVESVREMARQDGDSGMKEGFWYQLVESVDTGRVTGVDPKGEPQHAESVIAQVRRDLEDARRPLISKVSIKEVAFSFHKEGVNQYTELVSRLKEQIRAARVIVETGVGGLKRAAAEGEVVSQLKLDPISERYLILKLLEQCENKWIPEAEKQRDQARMKDIGNAAVAERLDNELYQSLKESAQGTFIGKMMRFRKDEAFYAMRDEAQDYYRGVGGAARRLFDAEVNLAQFQEFLSYLKKRSRQFARLARHMNRLVKDLELEAEEIRQGKLSEPPMALSVEVFQLLDAPFERIWDRVYHALFIADGRYLNTFDRSVLAATITNELKPKIGEDGKVADRTDDETVTGLRRALIALGSSRMQTQFYGDGDDYGLDLSRGLELEAKLVLQPRKLPGEVVSPAEIGQYVDRKIRALSQLSGVLARVRTNEWRAFDDGVKADRLRYLTHGYGAAGARVPRPFLDRLENMLAQDGYALNTLAWHDPRVAIVYDVELPVPLYYVAPVIEDVERAYIQKTGEKLNYNLHTDKRWEEALPNLNPRSGEIEIGWAIQKLAEGLVAKIIERRDADDMYVWHPEGQPTRELAVTLSETLYKLGELRRADDERQTLQKLLERSIENSIAAMDSAERLVRRESCKKALAAALEHVALQRHLGAATPSDVLDEPILAVLEGLVDQDMTKAAAAGQDGYKLRF